MQRKTVTVLFCDVAGSTELGESVDPEALRSVLARYFERMKGIIEGHGGTVEKFIGDAVMAVFGVPVAHEDDALRAVRAAVEMRDALPDLGLQARIGVNTGEVVTGTEERLATGDAVNVAARLEQAAGPGEVFIGEATLALVLGAAEVEPVPPLRLKGKREPVPAYRLLSVREVEERTHETPLVGRQSEFRLLREAWDRAQSERRCEQVTILGDAGVGKSRLAAEFLGSVEGVVARGHCLPYGEGITYWPVVEVLKQLPFVPADEAAGRAIRSVLGESDVTSSAEDIAWAFRKTLEAVARERPLVVVFDDIHRGEDTFLDLIEHVTLLSSDAPILLLCLGRPELAERRPAWPVALRLEPLGPDDVQALMAERIPVDLREKIARAAGGNPLFVLEMLAMAGGATGEVVVPPTLQALLAARLDQLDPPERGVLECGAVEGEVFHRGAVQALRPDQPQVTPRLTALVRKELIRPDRPLFPGEDGFRFRHLLIRDAAYDALPKADRAELHQRLAAWLEERGPELVELDEILGYHLERACRYRDEVGLPADHELREQERRNLTAAGHRAYLRGDYRAAVSLLEPAAALVPPTGIDLLLESTLIDALFESGRGTEAQVRADRVADRARAAGDRVGELCARILAERLRSQQEPEGATDRLAALVDEALPEFEAAGNDLALYIAYFARGVVELTRGRLDAMSDVIDRAIVHARAIGLPLKVASWRNSGRIFGTMPAGELLAWLDSQADDGANVFVRGDRIPALAMLGRFEEARALRDQVQAELRDRGADIEAAATMGIMGVDLELLAGDPAAAARLGEESCRRLDELGEQGFHSTAAGELAQALYALGRLEDADAWAARAAELGASDDAATQMLSRQVRAKVLARRGDHAEAQRLAEEAVSIGEKTDMLNARADADADLAEVLELAGRHEPAAEALRRSLAGYERKGNVPMIERVRARLSALPSGR